MSLNSHQKDIIQQDSAVYQLDWAAPQPYGERNSCKHNTRAQKTSVEMHCNNNLQHA